MSGGWWKKWCLLFALAISGACATDSVPQNAQNQREDPNSCSNPCEVGETRCNGASIEACASDAKGCFRWAAGVDCAADGTMCDDSSEPAICLTEPGTCQDGALNQDESDVDCGGQRCVACEIGKTCDSADDCESNNCDLGVSDACVPSDQETCTDGSQNQDETDVDCGGGVCPACEEGAECSADTDCASGSCDNGTCEPGGGPCNDGEVRCSANTVQTCEAAQWVETQICAQACAAGACDDAVQCQQMATRCFKNSVQQCNANGTAWQHLDICNEDCDAGLCTGACEPNALRCNGDKQEVCGADGQTWTEQESCALGCSHRVCIQDALENKGVPTTMSGTHVYEGCVDIELGGSIDVPADETLEIWAKCLNVTQSSSINLGSGATLIFHATETITNDGTISGGAFVRLDAYQSLTNSGDISSNRVEVRGDVLTNAATGTIGGSDSYALYGSEWTNDGTHDGVVSVMPPETLSSPTHPEGYQWNMADDAVSVAWNKPFASVKGYYVAVNSGELPSPSNGEFTTSENVTLPLELFRPGLNHITVVSVNDDSTVGEVTADFAIDFNVTAPNVTSTSHPDPFEWSATDDVFIEWADANSVEPDSFVGYWYAWDHRGDTNPDENTGTFRNDNKILFNDQASGVWTFHIVNIDRFGRTSPVPGRYEVRIGPDPGAGNIAGTITDADGEPVRGAAVSLNGGVYRATTVASGDYTFRGEVPAAAFDWEVSVEAPGYMPKSEMVRIGADAAEVVDFELASNNRVPVYKLGYEVQLDSGVVHQSEHNDIALGRPGEVIWSANSRAGISTTTGQSLTPLSIASENSARIDVGWDGHHYFAASSSYCSYYVDCVNYLFYDAARALVQNRRMTGWDDFYAPSMVWDGSRFVLVGFDDSGLRVGSTVPEEDEDGPVASGFSSSYGPQSRTAAFFDGSAIAVAALIHDGRYKVIFTRVTRDGSEVQAPVTVADLGKYGAPVGLAFDGDRYHVTYKGGERKSNGEYPLYIRSVDTAGTLGAETELDSESSSYGAPMVAFDGRNLIVAYSADGRGFVEVRDPSNYDIVESFSLGFAHSINIDFGYHVGAAAIVYGRDNGDRTGLQMRQLTIR